MTLARELDDLLGTLAEHRWFLRRTAEGLDDQQARLRTGASELTVGGTIKHCVAQERIWTDFLVRGAVAHDLPPDAFGAQFVLRPDETLAGVLAEQEQVAAATEALVRSFDDLDTDIALPTAPWFPPGARWSRRKVLLHLLAELAQHSGHADVVREGIDGAKTMG
ncbi:Protein of unknown function [Klenkia marina]|uniref:DinB superfamily protein n=1 Tax=Klenkia marina TaxID=1960309 RepID=A0A1G4XC57_9ACTN|nr:DinB family protein [Klenkia marina]SCX38775.1 Protein of unknown function [Klenkia marina]